MASVSIRKRTTKNGETRYLVEFRSGGRESTTRHGGSFRTIAEAHARRDYVAEEIAAGRLPERVPMVGRAAEVRFWEKVAPGSREECWLWTGAVNAKGYPLLRVGPGPMGGAHRFAYELFVAAIPEAHVIHHRCMEPRCVNPGHLESMTAVDHQRLHAGAA